MSPSLRAWALAAVAAAALALPGCARATHPDPVPAGDPAQAGWWEGEVFYEIFVRSFADSDGDGQGDLRGLLARLDHINDGDPATSDDLGATGIWLMPIYPSPSYHGYDVTDYRGVHPDYGTLDDFDRFLAEAHERGIRVILDFVLNHSSAEHPWFLEARASEDAATRDHYVWRDAPDDRWRRPWDQASVWHPTDTGHYYGLFWSGMPDLNLESPAVREEMLAAMRFWLDRGVDGFRIDAARHLVETEDGQLVDTEATHAFVRWLRREIEASHPSALLLAEAWSDTTDIARYYGQGDEFHLAFAFGTSWAILEGITDGARAHLNQTLARAEQEIADRSFEAPFLTNHDMRRVMHQLGGDGDAARLAIATLMAMPGTPFLYYGEEIGMVGGPDARDEDKRTPMRWTTEAPGYGFSPPDATPWHQAPEAASVAVSAQTGDPGSLLSWYRRLIRLRGDHGALAHGETRRVKLEGGGRGCIAVLREHEGERVLFLANLDKEPAPPMTAAVQGSPRLLLASPGAEAAVSGGEQLTAERMPPRSFIFLAY
jgi:glycosidase